MDRTDEELDRDWVPNGRRPQSTVARSFSAELMDIFRIENSIAELGEKVDRRYVSQRLKGLIPTLEAMGVSMAQDDQTKADIAFSMDSKQQVTSGQSELQALEARLKEMESKLQSSHAGSVGRDARAQRQPFANKFVPSTQPTEKELPQRPLQTSSRPGTAKQSQHAPMHGGAMPPTPTASEGEFDLVNSSSHDRDAETAGFADYIIIPKDGEDRDS